MKQAYFWQKLALEFMDFADDVKEAREAYAIKLRDHARLAGVRFIHRATDIIREETTRALTASFKTDNGDSTAEFKRDFDEKHGQAIRACGAQHPDNEWMSSRPNHRFCTKPHGHQNKSSAKDLHSDGTVTWE